MKYILIKRTISKYILCVLIRVNNNILNVQVRWGYYYSYLSGKLTAVFEYIIYCDR